VEDEAPQNRSSQETPQNLPRKLELWSYRFVGFLGLLYEGIRAIIHK